jgi:hypothetical protein
MRSQEVFPQWKQLPFTFIDRLVCSTALPSQRLRLDPPLLLIKGLRFAPMNADDAPLTAQAASRRGPLGRAFVF